MVSYQGVVVVIMWTWIQKLSAVSFPALPQIEPRNLELTAQYVSVVVQPPPHTW